MSTTTKRQRKQAAEPLTFEQIAERKLRENLETYRGYVEKAAAGEFLDEQALERVAELLAVLRLPELAWKQHVDAVREHRVAVERQREIEAAKPTEQAQMRELTGEVQRLEKLLQEKRLRLGSLQRSELRLVDALRKQNELRTLYPDVLATVDNAVTRRREYRPGLARHRDKPTGATEDGWST